MGLADWLRKVLGREPAAEQPVALARPETPHMRAPVTELPPWFTPADPSATAQPADPTVPEPISPARMAEIERETARRRHRVPVAGKPDRDGSSGRVQQILDAARKPKG